MERTTGKGGKQDHKGAILIVRDALIFAMVMLAAALIYVIAPRMQSAQTSSNETAQAAIDTIDVQAEPIQTELLQQVNSTATVTAEPSATPEIEQTPAPTATPLTASGDFSSVFPSYDTGADAMLSSQTDNFRISIRKEQAYDSTYFVADVWVKNIDVFQTAFAKGSYGRGLHEMPAKIAQDNKAIFAVSGDYYGAREYGVVVRNGVLYRDVMGDDVCVLKRDGTMQVYQNGSISALETFDETVWQAWAFGPALVENGTVCDTSSSKIKVKNPRCAIGYYEPGHYCFIVVDGRQTGYSDGMTLDELANTFAALGCQTAYNLDGGATAMMVFDGAVVNKPTNGGRSSSDIICF